MRLQKALSLPLSADAEEMNAMEMNDRKPKDTKAKDTKAEDTKAEDTKPKDSKPKDTKAEDTKVKNTKLKGSELKASEPKNSRASLQALLDASGVMLIDGAMSTALEQLGCDLNNKLWTAKVLEQQPELIEKVHEQYFEAGADCGISCSYQASIPGLMADGLSEKQAEALIARSVELLRGVRDRFWDNYKTSRKAGEDAPEEPNGKGKRLYPRHRPLCLGSVGPYGAYLADGSEYRGRYGVSDSVLYEFHRRRMELLWNAGADLLLIETQPSLREVMIETAIAEELGAEYWVSFSCADGAHTHEGDRLTDCVAALSKDRPHLRMIGVNCVPPDVADGALKTLVRATALPVAVYPNSGEIYDPTDKTWHGAPDGRTFYDEALRFMKDGASAVGGCCRTSVKEIRETYQARETFRRNQATKKIR